MSGLPKRDPRYQSGVPVLPLCDAPAQCQYRTAERYVAETRRCDRPNTKARA
jgi:hypothetical protein